MSGAAPPTPRTAATPEGSTATWRVRGAERHDAAAIAAAVAELLVELGAEPPAIEAMLEVTRALLSDPHAGALFVAEAEGALVGLLTASWQSAIHVPGRYALIQDLWVHSAWRSRAIGAALLQALRLRADELGIARLEVCLPKESFAGLAATAAFYRANGFTDLGPRMRWLAT